MQQWIHNRVPNKEEKGQGEKEEKEGWEVEDEGEGKGGEEGGLDIF